MPVDKQARYRYKIINSCFTNKRKRRWTIIELLEAIRHHGLKVTQRTVERDLEKMRYDPELGFKAVIPYDSGDYTYHYEDTSYSIYKFPITPEDLFPLRLAMLALRQFKGLNFVKHFEGLFEKLTKAIEHSEHHDGKDATAGKHTPFYKGQEHYDKIAEASIDKQPLLITYGKFGMEKVDHVFHPYFIEEYEDRWYVTGYSETRDDYRTLGLDRVVASKPLDIEFKASKAITQEDYFKNTLGITVGKGPVETIELWFSPFRAYYVNTQHIHHSQKTITEDSNGLTITLSLIPNPELTKLILSYGSHVTVIAPLSLREEVKKEIDMARDRYN